jgi:hypothetical protein
MESPARNEAMLHNHKRKSKAENKNFRREMLSKVKGRPAAAFLSSKYGERLN